MGFAIMGRSIFVAVVRSCALLSHEISFLTVDVAFRQPFSFPSLRHHICEASGCSKLFPQKKEADGMRTNAKFVLAAALLLPYLSANAALASGQGGSGKGNGPKISQPVVTVVGFKAQLDSVVLDGNGEGEAEYKMKSSTLGTKESFEGEAEFSIPDPSLGITDLNSAQTAQLEMHLSRGGTDYAVCSLAIKEIEFEYKLTGVQIQAEYGVSVSQQTLTGGTPSLSQKVGSCMLGTGPGVPTVAAGDIATVFSVVGSPAVSTQVLTGTFQ